MVTAPGNVLVGPWSPPSEGALTAPATSAVNCSAAGQGSWVATPSAWLTTGLADGPYDVRAVGTDNAGNVRTSQISGIAVDNTAPTLTLTNPGASTIIR